MSARLAALRELFGNKTLVGSKPLDYYLLPRTDYHNSEYIAEQDERVKYLSGFSGSNAFSIIGKSEALLWTDGRYFEQAAKELYEGWTLMKDGQTGVPSSTDWLLERISKDSIVGFDPHLYGYEDAENLMKQVKGCKGMAVPITRNLVDEIWKERPEPQIKQLLVLSTQEAGEDVHSKLRRIRETYVKKKCTSIIFGDLAEIAWLFNLRGVDDISFNPVFFSTAIVTNDSAHLFVDQRKLGHDAINHLAGVNIHPYETIISWLSEYHKEAKNNISIDHRMWVTNTTNYAWGSVISEDNVYVDISPIERMKAIKNETELQGMRNSHIRDSGAIVRFYHWLENEIQKGSKITEKDAADKVHYFRTQVKDFVSESFDTISAVGEHASFPHYHMTEESGKAVIEPNNVFLLDNGGQYRDGTTDVTRTVVLGTASDYVKKMNTLVLKGHIKNAMQVFPDNTNAMRLDSLARSALWDRGYDFGHGVGHGIGHFLNVHEFPPSIGKITPKNALTKGIVVTIEPGYYEPGSFGIRIENGYEIVEAKDLESKVAHNFIKFRSLTWVPIQTSLIQKELLDEKEIGWLNDYHATCLEKTGSYLKSQGLSDVYEYLKQLCKPF